MAASCWLGEEADALIVFHLVQTAEPGTAIEESWLLDELHERFVGLPLEELARRFGHSVSWVNRRLALIHELPDSIQERVRGGLLRNLSENDCQDLARLLDQSRHEIERLAEHFTKEMGDVGSEHPSCDSEARQQGHSIRGIARAMKISRGAVREVLRSATEVVPALLRSEKTAPYRDQILDLYVRC